MHYLAALLSAASAAAVDAAMGEELAAPQGKFLSFSSQSQAKALIMTKRCHSSGAAASPGSTRFQWRYQFKEHQFLSKSKSSCAFLSVRLLLP